jgi:peroxiredoxin
MIRLACAVVLALLAGCGAAPTLHEKPREEREGGPDYVTLGAEPIASPASAGVGEPVAFAFQDVDGSAPSTLSALRTDARAVVVLFTSLRCPVTRRYAPSLQERAERWAAQGIRLLVVDPSIVDEREDLLAARARNGWTFALAQDPDYAICDALGVQRTAATFLIGPEGRLRYRGALDDQFGINYQLDAPRARYMEVAIAAVLTGDDVPLPATTAPGCVVSRVRVD